MKRFLFPVVFGVCVAGCLVDTGCAAIGKVFDRTAIAFVRTVVPIPAFTGPPAPPAEATAGEPTAVDNEPLVPESVPTWLAGITTLLALIIPSKGVAPIGRAVGGRLLKMLSTKTK